MPKDLPGRKPSHAPGDEARRRGRPPTRKPAGATAAAEVSDGRVTIEQAKADPDPKFGTGSAGAAEQAGSPVDGGPGLAPEFDGAELEDAGHLTGDQLLELCDMSKGLLVRLLAVSWKLEGELVDKVAPINPTTRSLLANFADQAAQYLPAANTNAPLIGALAFAGILAGDLISTWGKLKAGRPRREVVLPATEPMTFGGQQAPSSPVVGAEDLRGVVG